MAISLKAFAESLSTGEVVIRGQPIKIRALSDAEVARLVAMFPRPTPPLGPAIGKGSLAAFEPNHNDPKYLADAETWYDMFRRVQLAASCGFGEPGEEYDPALADGPLKDRLTKVAAQMSAAFSRPELARMWESVRCLLDSDAPKEYAPA